MCTKTEYPYPNNITELHDVLFAEIYKKKKKRFIICLFGRCISSQLQQEMTYRRSALLCAARNVLRWETGNLDRGRLDL